MSKTPKTIPDVLVLAAVERAVRHRLRAGTPSPIWEILRHLDISPRSGDARHVRARIRELAAAGVLARERSHGVDVWRLTPNGRRRLRRARGSAREPLLPESPQHKAWRDARALSGQEIGRTRGELRRAAERALRMLDAEGVSSDAWFELSEELRRLAWVVGSMTHCLHEWPEPDDARADRDGGVVPDGDELPLAARRRARVRRRGRRNPRLWRP